MKNPYTLSHTIIFPTHVSESRLYQTHVSWFVLISVYCLITSPNFGFRNFDGFGLYFGYQSVNNGMGFVDLVWILLLLLFFVVFSWVLVGFLSGRFKPKNI